MEARDLGLSSLQMQTLGAAMAGDTAALWSAAATNAAAIATEAQAPIQTTMSLVDSLGLRSNVDANALFSDIYRTQAAASTVSPDTVFTSALGQYNQLLGWGVDTAKTNQMAQAQYDSMALQYRTDVMNAQVAMHGAQASSHAMLGAASLNAAATSDAARINSQAVLQAAYADAGARVDVANISGKASVDAAYLTSGGYKHDRWWNEETIPSYNWQSFNGTPSFAGSGGLGPVDTRRPANFNILW